MKTLEDLEIRYLENYHSRFLGQPDIEELEEDLFFELASEIDRLEKELKIKRDGFMASTKELCQYANIIDKAINFIKEHAYYEDEIFLCDKEVMELEEILKKGK